MILEPEVPATRWRFQYRRRISASCCSPCKVCRSGGSVGVADRGVAEEIPEQASNVGKRRQSEWDVPAEAQLMD
jgi:hypothetical protein